MNEVLKAVREASISIACLLDDVAVDENNDIKVFEIQKDIEHIQNQITTIENFLEPFTVAELCLMNDLKVETISTGNFDKRDFIEDVYDNLMKNTQYKPTNFSKIEDCWIDYDTLEIYIGDFVLTAKEIKGD